VTTSNRSRSWIVPKYRELCSDDCDMVTIATKFKVIIAARDLRGGVNELIKEFFGRRKSNMKICKLNGGLV
jgi:hypothetical protein